MAKGDFVFGTAGIPHSSGGGNSVSGIRRIRELGLGAMELEFVRGVHMKKDAAEEVDAARRQQGVVLSVHAPYFINLNSREKKKIGASKKRILDSVEIGGICGAYIVVFHPGFYMGMNPEDAYKNVKRGLEEVKAKASGLGNGVLLGLETTGKGTQFGTLEEIMRLSSEVRGVVPCIDFSHLHARGNGALKKEHDFDRMLETVEGAGKKFLRRLHIHASGINYTPKGERNHMNLRDRGNDFDYRLMLNSLKKFKASGTVICESPNLEGDALLMKKYWDGI